MDLLLPPAFKNDPPKLDIKKDQKGMVTVQGATIVEVGKSCAASHSVRLYLRRLTAFRSLALHILQVTSAKELLATLEAGQQRRHVASTNMNRESSRSHLVMSIIIESTNLQTQSVSKGKLSFVDLAGSERLAEGTLIVPLLTLPLPRLVAHQSQKVDVDRREPQRGSGNQPVPLGPRRRHQRAGHVAAAHPVPKPQADDADVRLARGQRQDAHVCQRVAD